jgi:hypothetical protein
MHDPFAVLNSSLTQVMHSVCCLLYSGRNSNGNRSPLVGAGIPHGTAAAAAAAAAAGDRPQSVYLEHSLDDSDVLVMRTMSDWSQDEVDGSSSSSLLEQQQQQQGEQMLRGPGGSYPRSRSQKMPQIDEGEGEASGDEGEQQQSEAQQQQQRAAPPG